MKPRAGLARLVPRLQHLERRLVLSNVANHSLFVRFAATATPAQERAAIDRVDGHILRAYPEGPIWVALGRGSRPASAVAVLKKAPGVVFAEVDAKIHVSGSVVPNDPGFAAQWGLNQANNVDIDAPQAWAATTGSATTIVAVIDTGIDLGSPDLAGKVWTNPSPGALGDVHGWNFVNNTPNVQDDNGHGSHGSGIIAAAADNATGVAGVNWNAEIMPMKFLDARGGGTTDEAVAAIDYAVDHGARVINASWGGRAYSRTLAAAIAYAGAHNVVFVTASGNTGTNNDRVPSYPANDRQPNELSVAAIGPSGDLARFSNYGRKTVDLAAPGVNILSTVPGGYAYDSGTSMSAPYVSGVVSLLVGLHPDWTAVQIVATVKATVKPLPGLKGRVATGGIVDAAKALGINPAPPAAPDAIQARVVARPKPAEKR